MKCGGNQPAMRTVAVRALLFTAVAALTLIPVLTPVIAADSESVTPATASGGGSAKMRFISLGIGKSMVVDLPRDVKDVLVADPKIANAVVRSAHRAYIIGSAVGQTNVVFSMPRASRSRPMTSRSPVTSTAYAPRCGRRCRESRSTAWATV